MSKLTKPQRDDIPNYYAKTFNDLARMGLHSHAVSCWIAIATSPSDETMNQEKLAELLNISLSTVKMATNQLKKKDLLIISPIGYNQNHWFLGTNTVPASRVKERYIESQKTKKEKQRHDI